MSIRTLGRLEEFEDGAITVRDVGGKSIGIFRQGDRLYGMLNVCPHKGAPICAGNLGGTMLPCAPGEAKYGMDGVVLRCPWHGWEYDARTGESVGPVDRRNLTMFEVGVKNGQVEIDLASRGK